jgi:hypothetical protein
MEGLCSGCESVRIASQEDRRLKIGPYQGQPPRRGNNTIIVTDIGGASFMCHQRRWAMAVTRTIRYRRLRFPKSRHTNHQSPSQTN